MSSDRVRCKIMYYTVPNWHDIESIIRDEIRKKGETDPICRLELIKKEIDRQLSAEKLLKYILGDDRYREFIDNREIKIESKKYPGRYYIIREFGMIEVFENDTLKERLCINPTECNFPLQDQLVAKILGLEGAEELILKTANHTSIPIFSEFCRRIIKEFNLEFDPFSDRREDFLKRIREEKKFNLEFDPFS